MPRSLIPAMLSAVLAISLVCSNAIRHGHADVPIAATADEIQPLVAGDPAPRFIVRTVEGKPFDFNPEQLERPAVLLTFRGGWCPYCNMYLSDMRHVVPDVRELGVDVLFLSGDGPAQLYESLEGGTQEEIEGLDYTILSDGDAQAAIALGIAFKASERTIRRRYEKGQDIADSSMASQGVLPVPAVFAIDTDGTVRFSYVNPDYKTRLPADELLAVAQRIATAD
ncbi:MAG: peroxiredoxin-like family protein [Woeseiaceae bacterium]|nr:peroxiredoxin-like family protein [Woeseiaceae bacterium]